MSKSTSENPANNSNGSQSANHQSQLGRNELCSCGSGKKFKKCCLKSTHSNGMLPAHRFKGHFGLQVHIDDKLAKANQLKGLVSDFDTEIGLFLLVFMSDGREAFFRVDIMHNYIHYLHNKLLELNMDFETLYYYAHQEIFKTVNTNLGDEIDFKGSSEYLLLSFPVIREFLFSKEFNRFGCIFKICENDHSETLFEIMELDKWEKDVDLINKYGIDEYVSYRAMTDIFRGLNFEDDEE